jgi:hypothetical protein
MSWATVMMFRRGTHAELIFDCMRMIRDNWRHYKDLYRIASSTYRNDHALSIALNIVNGQTLEYTSIPWNLASVTPEHTVTRTSKDCYRIDYSGSRQTATLDHHTQSRLSCHGQTTFGENN